MSDAGRKSFTDKASEAVKPDSEKSYLEQAKEGVTNAADGIAANGPDSEKGFGQTIADNAKQGKDDAEASLDSNQQTMGETASEYVEAAKEQVANAANYVAGVVSGAVESVNQAGSEKK